MRFTRPCAVLSTIITRTIALLLMFMEVPSITARYSLGCSRSAPLMFKEKASTDLYLTVTNLLFGPKERTCTWFFILHLLTRKGLNRGDPLTQIFVCFPFPKPQHLSTSGRCMKTSAHNSIVQPVILMLSFRTSNDHCPKSVISLCACIKPTAVLSLMRQVTCVREA
jgi:hypothetical protein